MQQIPLKEYNSLVRRIENGRIDEVIKELVDRLQAESDINLKRKIRNFVRSFIAPDKKVICRILINIWLVLFLKTLM